jgi:hypothetical protein
MGAGDRPGASAVNRHARSSFAPRPQGIVHALVLTMANNDKNPRPQTPPQDPRKSHNIDPEHMAEHEGATEEEVSDVPAPAVPAFDDEPRQG